MYEVHIKLRIGPRVTAQTSLNLLMTLIVKRESLGMLGPFGWRSQWIRIPLMKLMGKGSIHSL